jgi:hypothetical protein
MGKGSDFDVDEALAQESLEQFLSGVEIPGPFAVLCLRSVSRLRAHIAVLSASRKDSDFAAELGHEFLLEKSAGLRVSLLAQGATPQAAVLQIRKAAENWLNDTWRTGPFGSMQNRLRQVLAKEPKFVRTATGFWALSSTSLGQWDGDEEALLRAAIKIPTALPNWSSEARRSPLTGNPDDLLKVLTAILGRAWGPLPIATLTRVCLARFPHAGDPTVSAISEGDQLEEPMSDRRLTEVLDTIDAPAEIAEAWAIVDELTDDQKFILLNHEDSQAIQQRFNVKRSRAGEIRKATLELIGTKLKMASEPHAVGQALTAVLNGTFSK